MQKLPVGLSDFKQVIEKNYYYVDKSLLIKELMEQGAVAMLIPRPRRFGKTLNLSMLRCFFEKTESDTSHLFRHLKIWQTGEEYTSRQGKYPVIYLTFKDIKEPNWASALEKIKRLVQEEFLRHKYLRNEKALETEEQEYFDGIANLTASQNTYEDSLKKLCSYLARYHHQQVILLIDEYDTPIQAGYVNGYYAEVVGFMRNFLSGGLKDNPHLEKGVLTGILRVAKESIFSGLNNLGVFTLLRSEFSTAFGLTEAEVEQALRDFQLADQYENIRNWYNGYIFGDQITYNPWSIINYLNSADKEFRPYWANTSDNAVIEQLLTRGGTELKSELESLIQGEKIEKPIEENIIFRDIEKKDNLLWSFLLFGGYLKYVEKRTLNKKMLLGLQIPNLEVSYIYDHLVEGWFEARLENEKLEMMLKALIDGDMETFEEFFAELVANSFSFWDAGGRNAEKVYQAFAIGLLVWLSGRYEVKSNRESGYGRYDVMLIPRDPCAAGIIIEFKKVNTKRSETKDSAFVKAFQQIENKGYAAELQQRGIQQIRKLAIVFKGKQVWVKEQSVEG
ncbi:ATP-binding protein [candidate division KSB1 bacterium]|nr:ATP-binding protein [candidate division KSB1 bacterium]